MGSRGEQAMNHGKQIRTGYGSWEADENRIWIMGSRREQNMNHGKQMRTGYESWEAEENRI